jgi:DNA-binding transcriptional MerR regulator
MVPAVYTIKQASIRSGVSVPLLRQWERRYGIVTPARTRSGYRQYDEMAIARLRRMRVLVDDGWSPSAAAASLGDPGTTDASILIAADSRPAPDVWSPNEDLVHEFVRAAAALDAPAMDAALDEMFVRGTFEQAAERYLLPALRAIGAAWANGQGDVAAEHAASAAVLHRLGAAYHAAGRSTKGRPILVGLPPGARHELGALAFSVAARRSGLPTLYLGADLPVQDWVDAVRHAAAVGAVIGVVTPADVEPALGAAAAMKVAHPELLVAFGGPAVDAIPRDDWHHRLPAGLTAAVDALQAALAARRGGDARSRSGG